MLSLPRNHAFTLKTSYLEKSLQTSRLLISALEIHCNFFAFNSLPFWLLFFKPTLTISFGKYRLSFIFSLISSQSLNLGGRRSTTDDVATMPFHPSLFSTALRESPNSICVHSLMLSSHLFFCLSLILAPFTVPCRTVFAMPENLEMWPYHPSFHFFTMVRRSSCTPVAF